MPLWGLWSKKGQSAALHTHRWPALENSFSWLVPPSLVCFPFPSLLLPCLTLSNKDITATLCLRLCFLGNTLLSYCVRHTDKEARDSKGTIANYSDLKMIIAGIYWMVSIYHTLDIISLKPHNIYNWRNFGEVKLPAQDHRVWELEFRCV